MKRCRLHKYPKPNPNPKKKNKKPESNANSLHPDSVIISSLELLRSQYQSSSSSPKTLILKEDQSQFDNAVVDSRLSGDGVVSRPGGVVIGRLMLTMEGNRIDCNKIGVSGMIIPPNVDYVGNLQSDALFILLVEDDDLFMRIVDDKFYQRFSCIIIRPNMIAKGQPDGATGTFLRLLSIELKLPVFALVDSDPYGLKTLSVYMRSSDSENLTALDIKWLGMRPSDLDKYQIPDWCRLLMTDQDIKAVKDLLEEDFVKRNKGWVMELEMMLKMRQKVEIVALCSFGFQYITETYLPLKLQQQDWL